MHLLRIAEADWHIAEARKRIAKQRALVEALARGDCDDPECRELLVLMEEALRLMLAHREFVSDLRGDRPNSRIRMVRAPRRE
jgi:hypothetical protein